MRTSRKPFFHLPLGGAVILPLLFILSSCGGYNARPAHTFPLSDTVHRSAQEQDLLAEVTAQASLSLDSSRWGFSGTGKLSFVNSGKYMKESPEKVLPFLQYPTLPEGVRPYGGPSDPDYGTYGRCSVTYEVEEGERDWSSYDRILLRILPLGEGAGTMGLNLSIPGSDGSHLMNMEIGRWNTLTLDLGEIPHDNVSTFTLSTSIRGKDLWTAPDSVGFVIGDLTLQSVSSPRRQHGWIPDPGRIVVSSGGYLPSFGKSAILSCESASEGDAFTIRTLKGKVVYSGTLRKVNSSVGEFLVADFSSLEGEGQYEMRCGNLSSPAFSVGRGALAEAAWKVLNYIYCQRCGDSVEGIHSSCHHDMFAHHGADSIPYGGGWHDAGDLSQQTLQTGEVAYNLIEASTAFRSIDRDLSDRLLEEARWGYSFLLQTRFGDGWRASSMGLLHFTDDTPGTADDIHTVRRQNCALDNFLLGAYEALGAEAFAASDPAFASSLRQAAVQDYGFALGKFERDGFDEFLYPYEHQYGTSHSLFMAISSWSSSVLERLTGEREYGERAEQYMRYVLESQHMTPLADGTVGFFHTDTTKTAITHFAHQSREQMYMMALSALLSAHPDSPEAGLWKESMGAYGGYLSSLMQYTYPYGMLPAGVYGIGEPEMDMDAFFRINIFSPRSVLQRYPVQLREGVDIDGEHFIRRFPVWFGVFNGNNAIILSSGKAAAICGETIANSELRAIGASQIAWINGLNPFGQSMIYGHGSDYPAMSSFTSGEIVGEMPVGIRSFHEEDIPYWPAINNACYKEVWTTVAGKYLSLLSSLL